MLCRCHQSKYDCNSFYLSYITKKPQIFIFIKPNKAKQKEKNKKKKLKKKKENNKQVLLCLNKLSNKIK